jgi:crotonobetainyl-CoA:carnitine CoA-transferase CaiB-like acyl-CoA transferase
VPTLLGYGDGTPRFTAKAIPDAIAGTHAAAAVLTALARRAATGEGCAVDLSQHEAAIEVLGEYFLDYQLSGGEPPVVGNGHTRWAPHGVYPTAGDDRYVAIAVRNEAEWTALSDLAGRGWAGDPRFTTLAGRRDQTRALDEAIAAWTCRWPASDLVERLQAVGVAAGAVLTGPELLADPHLRGRGFFVSLDQPDVGPRDYPGTPVRIDGERGVGWRPAPTLGQDNAVVLGGLLGMSNAEVAALVDQGVIVDRPPA